MSLSHTTWCHSGTEFTVGHADTNQIYPFVSSLGGLVEEERLRQRESSGAEERAGQRSLTCEGARGRMERKREEEVWKTQANTTARMTFINHPI